MLDTPYFTMLPEASGEVVRPLRETPFVPLPTRFIVYASAYDELIAIRPYFLVTTQLKTRLEQAQLTGVTFECAHVVVASEAPLLLLKSTFWQLLPATTVASPDVQINSDGTLIVSEKALAMFKSPSLKNCTVLPLGQEEVKKPQRPKGTLR
ncbi:MAG: hypothetical protein Q7S87_10280 [Agitococcus sp.]|nr:hypothetical protein [Agitococcus sp.]MDO9177614.1 hypothetical protein [Agitococcus sp.]